jgi:hypothetical protein
LGLLDLLAGIVGVDPRLGADLLQPFLYGLLVSEPLAFVVFSS